MSWILLEVIYCMPSKNVEADSATPGLALPIKMIAPIPVSDEFKQEVLASLRDDEIGSVCKTDSAIVEFGNVQSEGCKEKPDKRWLSRNKLVLI